ncbi:Trm112 family protein [Necropsobacter rosorum]|uniref:Trm112 family protein n=1 Tax=Necropsobacter rosorum TaxID=908285 RepID=UPI0005098A51
MNARLLEIIACPMCQGRLNYDKQQERLICRFDQVAYPIEHGIPVLLAEQAQPLSQDLQQDGAHD